MTVNVETRNDANQFCIIIRGSFDFSLHAEFREAMEAAKKTAAPKYCVDLGAVADLDSSALGMLLLLREATGGERAKVTLINCRPEIREILEMANFQQMFNIT